MRICVITILAAKWGGTWETALYTVEVWVLGVGMSTLGTQTALYAEDRGLQVPMALEHGPVTSSGKAAPGPDPRIRHRTQIGMFRPIRMDHTNCLQVAIKTLQLCRSACVGVKLKALTCLRMVAHGGEASLLRATVCRPVCL